MNRDPPWDLYRSFLAVLEEHSLSGAARRLGLTQPTLARHIAALEQAVGADLFLRSQRGLDPTALAQDLAPYARDLAAISAALLRTASGHAQVVSGAVRVSASEVVGVEHLPPILTGLRRRHAALSIELVLSNAVDDLLQREADVAVRMVEPTQAALVAQRLAPIRLGFYAHRSYVDRRGAPASLAELGQHDLIGFDRETPAIRAVLKQQPAFLHAAYALRADSDLAQLAALRAGFGIGVCQAPVARRDPDLVPVLADAFGFDLDLWVVMHEDLKTSPRCRAVFDALVEGLRRLDAG